MIIFRRTIISRMPDVAVLSTTVGMRSIERRGRITDNAAWRARCARTPA